jgi:hypothetical protein
MFRLFVLAPLSALPQPGVDVVDALVIIIHVCGCVLLQVEANRGDSEERGSTQLKNDDHLEYQTSRLNSLKAMIKVGETKTTKEQYHNRQPALYRLTRKPHI